MGSVKAWAEHLGEIGLEYGDYDDEVCDLCIADEALRTFVSRHAPIERCSMCGATGRHGMSLLELFRFVVDSVRTEWDDPNNEVGWSGREGGWVSARVIDTDDLLSELDEPFVTRELRERFVTAVQREWCARDPHSLSADERLIAGWADFSHHVRHVERFFFHTTPKPTGLHRDEIAVADMLEEIRVAILNVSHRVLRRLPADSTILRGRSHEPGKPFSTAAELASPPPPFAQANRMSPAGISMFYGAEDHSTIAAELRHPPAMTIARWRTTRDLIYFDAADLPVVPSIFDVPNRRTRPWVRFLHEFAREMSLPATADNPEVTYVPTQIFTEFVRRALNDDIGRPVDAIRYRSATSTNGICWVVFADDQACASAPGAPDATLAFDGTDPERS